MSNQKHNLRSVSPTPSQRSGSEPSTWMQRKATYHTPPPSAPTSAPKRTPSYDANYSLDSPGGSQSSQRSSRYGSNELPDVPQERGRLTSGFANMVARRRAASPNRQLQ